MATTRLLYPANRQRQPQQGLSDDFLNRHLPIRTPRTTTPHVNHQDNQQKHTPTVTASREPFKREGDPDRTTNTQEGCSSSSLRPLRSVILSNERANNPTDRMHKKDIHTLETEPEAEADYNKYTSTTSCNHTSKVATTHHFGPTPSAHTTTSSPMRSITAYRPLTSQMRQPPTLRRLSTQSSIRSGQRQ